jgi:hypothetical protein
MNSDEISIALSPLEQMRAKIQDAEKEFAKTLRAEFAAIYAKVDELDDGICEAHFDSHEHLRKVLINKVLKGLKEVVDILSDGTDEGTN